MGAGIQTAVLGIAESALLATTQSLQSPRQNFYCTSFSFVYLIWFLERGSHIAQAGFDLLYG